MQTIQEKEEEEKEKAAIQTPLGRVTNPEYV